jgi:hypothetical protein
MFSRIVTQQPGPIAVQHCAGGEHFGVKQRAAREQPMEEPAMAIGPFHHRRDTEPMSLILHHFSCSLHPLGQVVCTRLYAMMRRFSLEFDA